MKREEIEKGLEIKVIEDEIYQFQKVFQPSSQDIPIIDLSDNRNSGKIDHEPEYQRKFIWKEDKQSYFIESIIYGIDTPIIYFIEVEKEIEGAKKTVNEAIDGRQRLSTILRFYNNDLKLKGLKEDTPLFKSLNGKKYKELDDKLQRLFTSYSIRTVTFKLVDRNIDIDIQLKFKYQLFHRYNSGLTALNQQEIRNCQYSENDFHLLFRKIAQTDIFKKVCPFFISNERMAGDGYITLLFMLTLFDDSLNIYAKKSKNPFINTYFKRIESNIYNYNQEGKNELDVSDSTEESEDDNDINPEKKYKEELKKKHIEKIENGILSNLEKVYKIYGKFIKGKHTSEQYLIETLYYHFASDKRISTNFLKNSSYDLGKYIKTELDEIENQNKYNEGQDFNLIDTYKEKPAHTARVRYRFDEMKKIINNYFNSIQQ